MSLQPETTTYTLTTFTPAEAERLTGVSVDLQRDWRRREYIAKTDGHARFDIFSLARLKILKALADRGIGPAFGSIYAGPCVIGVVYQALLRADAYEGDVPNHEAVYARLREEVDALGANAVSLPTIEAVAEAFKNNSGLAQSVLVSLKRDGRIKGPGPESFVGVPYQYFVFWGDFRYDFFADLSDAFDMDGPLSEVLGDTAVIIIDQYAIAKSLLKKAGRAFVHIEKPKPE